MTHVCSFLHLTGPLGAGSLADAGLAALTGWLYDDAHGGWFGAVRYDGPVGTTNRADEHAFVVLDAPSDVVAGRASAGALLADARNVLGRRFWREDERMLAKSWDAGWTEPGSHRG